MSRLCAPGLVRAADIDIYDLDNNSLLALGRPYNERFIHGEIYKAGPDVNSIVHCHAPPLIPFSVTKVPLRALFQVGSFLGDGAPVFEIRGAIKEPLKTDGSTSPCASCITVHGARRARAGWALCKTV